MTTTAVNIAAFLPAETFEIEIIAADGVTPLGWHVTLAGPSHPDTIATADTVARRALTKAAAIEAAQVNGRKHKPEERSPEEVRRENVEAVCGRIVDWTPVDIGNGPIKFTKAAAVELFLNPALGFAFVQVAEALASDLAFIKR